MKPYERLEGAIGFGVMMALVSNVGIHCYGVEVPPAAMIGFFICAFVPTYLFTGGK
jgi:hypothetical protein